MELDDKVIAALADRIAQKVWLKVRRYMKRQLEELHDIDHDLED